MAAQSFYESVKDDVMDLMQQSRDENGVYHINDACMLSLCTSWHGGQSSMMYRFMCSGPTDVDMTVLRWECRLLLDELHTQEDTIPRADYDLWRQQVYAMITYTAEHAN